ncbi:MAG: precorrin-3B C(17)-methyltransferase [Ahrensia sp.]|nr:precorrin-3B C(17)-methyltransferase [Ahrensia sp.]
MTHSPTDHSLTVEAPAIVVLNKLSVPLGRQIASLFDGELHGLSSRVEEADSSFDDTAKHLAALFEQGQPIIAIMAAGAIVRLLAPHLRDKHSEPPVIAVGEDGASVVPLLGGHHGANAMARTIAVAIDGHAAVTTAGDLRFQVALDEPPQGWVLANPDDAKAVMARLLNGETARIEGNLAPKAGWLTSSGLPHSDDASIRLTCTNRPVDADDGQLVYHCKDCVLGIGCERGTDPAEVFELAQSVLAQADLSPHALACIASLDVKADEAAMQALATEFDVPLRFADAPTLEACADRLKNPSDIVFAEVGCHGVAEGAALAASGEDGVLLVEKTKSKRATAAIARGSHLIDPASFGRPQGRLFVVGIGPGSEAWRSPEVTSMVSEATDLVGYHLYLDLLGPLVDGRTRHDFDLGKEEDRVRHAMELAGQGRSVALVCSGDAGIYAMATLVFELLDHGGLSDAASRIAIDVSPGISALQAAAARAGAPLGHDFCTISLSDLLTPWEDIKRRVTAAASGDFVIAFYNPVSRRRRTQLAYAKDLLLAHRPADTPVILATNLGRDGETVRVVSLQDLVIDDVDMLTVVIVGSSQTRTVATGSGKSWVYTPRGYGDKAGTKIGSAA